MCTSNSHIKRQSQDDDSILPQKEFRDMLFPDLDDLENLEDLDDLDDLDDLKDYLDSTTSYTTPSQRLEEQARLVCETLKTLAISSMVNIILVFGGAWIVRWLLAG